VERDACYEPIKDALIRHFANTPDEDRLNIRVLVPGTGLGRLSYEVAKLGTWEFLIADGSYPFKLQQSHRIYEPRK